MRQANITRAQGWGASPASIADNCNFQYLYLILDTSQKSFINDKASKAYPMLKDAASLLCILDAFQTMFPNPASIVQQNLTQSLKDIPRGAFQDKRQYTLDITSNAEADPKRAREETERRDLEDAS